MDYTINKTVTKIFTFDSAHHLPNYNGKCCELHGHTYKLEVTVSGMPVEPFVANSYSGILCDFSDLKKIVKNQVIDRLDHKDLNSVLGFIPTAENMVEWIFNCLWNVFPGKLQRIKLWETPDSFAEVTLQAFNSPTGAGVKK